MPWSVLSSCPLDPRVLCPHRAKDQSWYECSMHSNYVWLHQRSHHCRYAAVTVAECAHRGHEVVPLVKFGAIELRPTDVGQ